MHRHQYGYCTVILHVQLQKTGRVFTLQKEVATYCYGSGVFATDRETKYRETLSETQRKQIVSGDLTLYVLISV